MFRIGDDPPNIEYKMDWDIQPLFYKVMGIYADEYINKSQGFFTITDCLMVSYEIN